MEVHRMTIRDVLNIIENKWQYAVDAVRSSADTVVLRLPFSGKEEVENFRSELGISTSTEWIVYYNCSKRTKCYHKVWRCHLSSYRKRKTSKSKRDAGCPAKLDVLIKNITDRDIREDPYLWKEPPLRAVVTLSLIHNHSVGTEAALQLLRVSEKVKKKYFSFFSDGISPCDAMSLHKIELLSVEKREELAESSSCPTTRQLYHLYNLWRLKNLDPCDPFVKLKERLDLYQQRGVTVKFLEGDLWGILAITCIMKRSQILLSRKEAIFVESWHTCARKTLIVTIMLTATKAGAIPLALFIHKNQTTENYSKVFGMLKDNFPRCFNGNDEPVFITEDLAAKKNALKEVWPKSTQLLHRRHIVQAQWLWLCSQDDVPDNERPRLLKLFQNAVYADSDTILVEAVAAILKETKYPNFVRKFQKFYERKLEWAVHYHQNAVKWDDTINYADETIRMLQDVFLCQTKSYNVIALVEFSIMVWQHYLKKILAQYAYSSLNEPYLLYSSLCKKLGDYNISDVIGIEENVFLIQSQTDNVSYVVHTNIGICSCFSGRRGALCNHQYFLVEYHRIFLPSALPMNNAEKCLLALVALGEKCPQSEFFSELQDSQEESSMHFVSSLKKGDAEIGTSQKTAVLQTSNFSQNTTAEDRLALMKEFTRISNLFKQDVPRDVIVHFIETLKNIKTPSDVRRLTFSKSIHNETKRLRIQSTLIS